MFVRRLLIFLGLLLPAAVFCQSADSLFLKAAISRLNNARNYTLKVAAAMPAEKYSYKPVPDEMSFSEQLLHLAGNISWLSRSYLSTGEPSITGTLTANAAKADVIYVVTKTYDDALHVLGRFKKESLGDTVRFFAGPMNKLQIIQLLNDHQSHHRGQLAVYLRLNGIKPPDYSGW